MKCIVLSSGGLDSTVTTAIAKNLGYKIYSLSFDYEQRHKAELKCAKKVANFFNVEKHFILKLPIGEIGGSALTDKSIDVPEGTAEKNDIPITYVPGRNIIFLSFAVSLSEVLEAYDIFIGVNAVDYSGYPDCRPEFIESFEKTVNLGTKAGATGKKFKIHTPLIKLSKKDIILKGKDLGVDFSITNSCYNPSPEGMPCGRCDSCFLRLKGFKEAGIADPLKYPDNFGN
jgi:7-cyano-7-deazaguanine synthase